MFVLFHVIETYIFVEFTAKVFKVNGTPIVF